MEETPKERKGTGGPGRLLGTFIMRGWKIEEPAEENEWREENLHRAVSQKLREGGKLQERKGCQGFFNVRPGVAERTEDLEHHCPIETT